MIAKLFEKGIPSSGGNMMPSGGATMNSMGSSQGYTQGGPQRDPKFR